MIPIRARRTLVPFLAILFGIGQTAVCRAAEEDSGADQTRQTLLALLAVADAPLPPASSCYGHYGQTGAPKVRDLLALPLSQLYDGDNLIQGSCSAGLCALQIAHSVGTTAAATEIRFALGRGKAKVASLSCVVSP